MKQTVREYQDMILKPGPLREHVTTIGHSTMKGFFEIANLAARICSQYLTSYFCHCAQQDPAMPTNERMPPPYLIVAPLREEERHLVCHMM